ncbi:MAG: hypothetical protein ACM3O9_07520 [Methylocystaceae bacterium]
MMVITSPPAVTTVSSRLRLPGEFSVGYWLAPTASSLRTKNAYCSVSSPIYAVNNDQYIIILAPRQLENHVCAQIPTLSGKIL